jgi:lipopolysaccharide biosynthesis glycosyltransferase
MTTPVSICVFTDDRFAMHCGTMLASLLSHTHSDVDIHILDDGLSVLNQERLRSLQTLHLGNTRLIFHDVTDIDVSNAPAQPDWPQSIYKRLLITSIIPELDRVIMLDADMIVLGDIAELWKIELGDAWAAGVSDVRRTSNCHRLQLKDDVPYVNFGVLLLDLKTLRTHNVEEQFWEVLNQGDYDFKYIDQDVFNVVLHEHLTILPPHWNSQYIGDRYTPRDLDHFKNPAIIHYVTKNKPWLALSPVPRRHYYIHYLHKTPWIDEWQMQMKRDRWHLAPWVHLAKSHWARAFQLHLKKNKRFVRLFGITLMHDRDYV